MPEAFPDAHAFLEGRRTCGGPIFVIGGTSERRVTMYSQQCRALNMVAALETVYGAGLKEKRVGIAGAGAAGMTAAAALRALGVKSVTLYDAAAAPIHPQRASFTRFLHPRLFHWPEAGWDDDDADLPIGGWHAAYADTVRAEILSTCGDLQIQYCTTVDDITASNDEAQMHVRELESRESTAKPYDVVLVATGFPSEQPPDGIAGGSYWHAIEGLETTTGEIHIVGDGDGALTEVLMLFIDRLGHETLEEMARGLPHTPKTAEVDLAAQGDPEANATPDRTLASPGLTKMLASLDAGAREVHIHARNALKGGSFLLNRVIVAHLLWLRPPSVFLETDDVPVDFRPNGTVIWRAGIRNARQPRAFEQPALSTKQALGALGSGLDDPVARGALAQSIDALRRPLWPRPFEERLKPQGAWAAEPPRGWTPVHARPTERCTDALVELAATARELAALKAPLRVDAADQDRERVSIESVVRVLSISHEECVTYDPSTRNGVCRDHLGRLWFRLPTDGKDDCASPRGVAALVDPDGLLEWVPRRGWARKRLALRWADLDVSRNTLRGITDLAFVQPEVLRLTWRAHRARGEYEDAIFALLRHARVPAGEGHGKFGDRTRKCMLDTADVLREAGAETAGFSRDDIWPLLAGAVAHLKVPGPRGPRDLEASGKFIVTTWARHVSDHPIQDAPPWFAPFARIAKNIQSRKFPTPTEARATFEAYVLANQELQEHGDAFLPLSRFGVLRADSGQPPA